MDPVHQERVRGRAQVKTAKWRWRVSICLTGAMAWICFGKFLPTPDKVSEHLIGGIEETPSSTGIAIAAAGAANLAVSKEAVYFNKQQYSSSYNI